MGGRREGLQLNKSISQFVWVARLLGCFMLYGDIMWPTIHYCRLQFLSIWLFCSTKDKIDGGGGMKDGPMSDEWRTPTKTSIQMVI